MVLVGYSFKNSAMLSEYSLRILESANVSIQIIQENGYDIWLNHKIIRKLDKNISILTKEEDSNKIYSQRSNLIKEGSVVWIFIQKYCKHPVWDIYLN